MENYSVKALLKWIIWMLNCESPIKFCGIYWKGSLSPCSICFLSCFCVDFEVIFLQIFINKRGINEDFQGTRRLIFPFFVRVSYLISPLNYPLLPLADYCISFPTCWYLLLFLILMLLMATSASETPHQVSFSAFAVIVL